MAMNAAMRMMLADRNRNRAENNGHSEYGGDPERRMIGYDRNYDTENRRQRDSRGRYAEGGGGTYGYEAEGPHMGGYNTGYNTGYNNSYNAGNANRYEAENNGSYNTGYNENYGRAEARRRRDSRGRFMMGGMDSESYGDEYEPQGYRPQMHGGSRYGFGDVYAEVYAPSAMNRPMQGGAMGNEMSKPVDEDTARMWVENMDGGEHFELEQAEEYRKSLCPDCKKWEFYVAINAMHSDYCETARKIGKDTPEFYAHLARDFLKDKDSGPHKLRKYMTMIAR